MQIFSLKLSIICFFSYTFTACNKLIVVKRFFIYFFFVLFLFTACTKELKDAFLIEGKISNLTVPELYIVSGQEQNNLIVDTVICNKDGRFSYTGKSDSLISVIIYMEKGKAWTTVWAQNKEKIILSGNAVYPELILAKGNNINDFLSAFREKNYDILKERQDLSDRKSALGVIDSLSSDAVNESQYTSKILNLNYTLKDRVETFVKENPASFASLILIQDYIFAGGELEQTLRCLGYIEGEATQTAYFKELQKEVNEMLIRIKNAEIGSSAPDFSIVPMDKKDTLTLKSFKNRYLLLSFSASWCEFCHESNKDLVKIRKDIGKNKLEMLTIALDQDKSAWKNLSEEEKMTWYQFVDTSGWRSQLAYLYNVNEIPANILIDKNGVIIGRDLPVDSLIRMFK